MGCVASTDSRDSTAKAVSHNIDATLMKDAKKRLNNIIKILILGAGESGKSTVCKQFKILYRTELNSEKEFKNFTMTIQSNIIEMINNLLKLYNRQYQDKPDNDITPQEIYPANRKYVALTKKFQVTDPMTLDIMTMEDIVNFCKDEEIISLFIKNQHMLQLPESTPYFFEHISRIIDEKYIPTQEDCLRSRIRTSGASEFTFKVKDINYHIVDVGGQRSERRKWTHFFDDVTIVIFCASLIEYDQKLFENINVNRMEDSLTLFEQTCQTNWFKNKPFVLFLNKRDLFGEKLKRSSLSATFPDYKGKDDEEQALNFIKEKFKEKGGSAKNLYIHETCAIDTNNIKIVFEAIRREIVDGYVQTSFSY
jgi:GTPase SAR1 family protein